jgi:hypothetical protein
MHLGDALFIDRGWQPVILVDNGIGNKQSEKFFSYYYLHGIIRWTNPWLCMDLKG